MPSAAGSYQIPPDASTFANVGMSIPNGEELTAEVFRWNGASFQAIRSVLVEDAAVVSEWAAPAWLSSDYARYRVAVMYLARCPVQMDGADLLSSETGSAPLLASLQIGLYEENPFGRRNENWVQIQDYLTPSQFTQNRAMVPLFGWTVDELHWLQVESDQNTSGNQQTISAVFASTLRFEPWRKVIPGRK